MIEIPNYPTTATKKEDPVARSMAKPDACAKPGTVGNSKVRIRVTTGDKSLKPRKRKRKDPRDVQFY